MLTKQLELTQEQTSPLFRIMWISNMNEPQRRHFDNNICAFHIGNGFILTVAHNLKSEAQIFKSIDNAVYISEIEPNLNQVQKQLFNQCYILDPLTNKRYVNILNQNDFQSIVHILKQVNFDSRWLTLTNRNFCRPHLIIQFKNPQYYNDIALTGQFDAITYFPEPAINRHTFLIEIELVEAFYQEDIALYRIINTRSEIIARLPVIGVDFSVFENSPAGFYCLQSSPSSEVGKLLNKAQIEGFLDHFGIFPDRIGGNYTFEGLRYLIKGYFRFGSSGAPYLFYDQETNQFKVNAIQSEACPIQLSIDNKREGNFQYVNAIATPLNLIRVRLQAAFANSQMLHLPGNISSTIDLG